MRPKIAIYTCLTNYYDRPKPVRLKGADCYMFTDDLSNAQFGWRGVQIESTEDQRLQRKIKILGHPVLDKYDVTVYIDANMAVNRNLEMLVRRYDGGLWIGDHIRNCVYDEAIAIKKLGKAPANLIDAHVKWYKKMGFPKRYGMYSAGIIIRDKSTKEMCRIWHETLDQFSHRDQMSLPYALFKTNTTPTTFPLKSYLTIYNHKKKEPLAPIDIFYSSPFRSDKNIGKANNDFIRMLPDNAWVCITDNDACFLKSSDCERVEQVVKAQGANFGLIGCVTNRLGGSHQLYKESFNEDMDSLKHKHIPDELWEANGTDVVETTGVAGVFMLFSKATWKRVGGFKEKSHTCDTEFNKAVRRKGLRIGLAKGIYIFHNYRLGVKGQKKAQESIAHLL